MDTRFWHPRYWMAWLAIGILRVSILLPWKIQLKLGHAFGLLMFHLLKKRRFISCVNIELAFPELDKKQRQALVRQNFISLGKSLFESPLAWWGSRQRLERLKHVEGLEYLQAARGKNKGIVLLSAHTASLELGPRLLALYYPLQAIYRPHQNKLFDKVVKDARDKQYGKAIPRDNMRAMIRNLKEGNMIWYAQDQKPQNPKNRIFSPFFNVPTATNSALSKIVSLGDALVVPFFTFREDNGYKLIFLPALEEFPSDSLLNDATRINSIIESQIRSYPEQYLWAHKRFRDSPDGKNRYESYQASEKNNCG